MVGVFGSIYFIKSGVETGRGYTSYAKRGDLQRSGFPSRVRLLGLERRKWHNFTSYRGKVQGITRKIFPSRG